MSAIFLSHSSDDDVAAARVKRWLEERGHRSVFLDFDPRDGIPAGRNWEHELYRRLRVCRAVVVLCSEQSMASRWCFAEITHARSLGKQIFPLRIDDCTVDPVLTDLQVLDFRSGEEEVLERLGRGLLAAGVDASDPLDWDASRPPYPGLLAYQEQDAAVFFGRDREIGHALDLLSQMERYGGAALLLLLGSSGSGKSSVMRAGMLPRLRRAPERWLVVDPFRPGPTPADRLAAALARAGGGTADWREIRDALAVGGERSDDPGEALREQVGALRLGSDHPEATVLLFVDQLEELLGRPPAHPADRFLRQLAAASTGDRAPFLVVATLRSDFLASFQRHPALASLPFRSLSLGPIAHEHLREIVVRPAELAGVDMEPALVEALLRDTEAEDALPLLAFTLRELWELSRRADGRLELGDYHTRLGGLRGSVARAAEGVLAARPLEPGEEEGLRGAFLGMVRLGDDGNFARRAAGWEQLSHQAHDWLERFVQARLLVSRGDHEERTLEVAHEVLFRAWDRLAAWLDENREALRLRRDLAQATKLWQRGGRADEDLWRGGRLQRAVEVRDRVFERPSGRRQEHEGGGGRLPVAEEELEFLAVSEAAERRRARRRRRRRLAVVAVSLAVAAVSLALYLWALRQQRETEVQASRVLAQQAYTQRDQLGLALLLAVEASRTADTREARTSLASLVEARPGLETILDRQAAKVHAVAISPDGSHLAAAGDEGAVRLFDLSGGEGRDLAGDVRTFSLAFSPDGRKLAAVGTLDGAVRLWDVPSGALLDTFDPSACPPIAGREGGWDTAYGVAFNPVARTLATTDGWGLVRLWDESTGACLAQRQAHADAGNAVAFDPAGRWLASGGADGAVRLWRVTADDLVPGLPLGGAGDRAHDGRVMDVAFSPDGRTLASAGSDGRVRLWDLTAAPTAARGWTVGEGGALETLAFSRDGALLATSGADGVVRLWEPATGVLRRRIRAHAAVVASLAFGPGRLLATAGEDRSVRLWDAGRDGPSVLDLAAGRPVSEVALDADGHWAAVGDDGSVRVWDLTAGEVAFAPSLTTTSGLSRLAFSHDGALLAASDRDGVVRLWRTAGGEEVPLAQVEGDKNQVWSLAFAPGGKLLAAGAGLARVTLRDLAGDTTPVLLQAGPVPPGQTRAVSLAFSPHGRRLAAGIGPTLQLWDLSGCAELAPGCAGEALVTPADDPKAELFSLAFSPDGSRLYAGAGRGDIHRWRLESDGRLRPQAALEGPDSLVWALSPAADGTSLAAGTRDGRITLWNTQSGRAEVDLLGHGASVEALARRGERLLSADEDGNLRVWPTDEVADLAALRARACRIANRALSAAEWDLYIGPTRPYRPTCPP